MNQIILNKDLVRLILASVGFTHFISSQIANKTYICAGTYTPSIDTLRDLFTTWLSNEYFSIVECPNGAKCITIFNLD